MWCLGSGGDGCTCSQWVMWDHGHVTARRPDCVELTGGEALAAAHTGGTYLERRGCMLEAVVRCNARVSMLAALVQLDACRLRLGSVVRRQRQHPAPSTQNKFAWPTRWHSGDEGRGGEAHSRDTSRSVQYGVLLQAGEGTAEGPGRWPWLRACSESRADSQTARQADSQTADRPRPPRCEGPGED